MVDYTVSHDYIGCDKVDNDLVWLTIKGVDKREILEGLGFVVDRLGYISLDGKSIKAIDEDVDVKVDDVKAIMPGSLRVITDISELEILDESI